MGVGMSIVEDRPTFDAHPLAVMAAFARVRSELQRNDTCRADLAIALEALDGILVHLGAHEVNDWVTDRSAAIRADNSSHVAAQVITALDPTIDCSDDAWVAWARAASRGGDAGAVPTVAVGIDLAIETTTQARLAVGEARVGLTRARIALRSRFDQIGRSAIGPEASAHAACRVAFEHSDHQARRLVYAFLHESEIELDERMIGALRTLGDVDGAKAVACYKALSAPQRSLLSSQRIYHHEEHVGRAAEVAASRAAEASIGPRSLT